MYDWLTDALTESSTIVTANRRLTKNLRETYGERQIASGLNAWSTPSIHAWQDWLETVVACADCQESLPTKINVHQSEWLWERCLKREVGDTISSMSNLVRMARDSWQRLADWQISITEVARSTQNADQQMFAAAAGRYLAILQRHNWIDDAGLGALLLDLVDKGNIRPVGRFTFVGFDRQRPIIAALQEAIGDKGGDIRIVEPAKRSDRADLQEFDNNDAELRCAGAWARRQIEKRNDARVAIVVNGLEQGADRIARLVKEGFAPGWQYGPPELSEAVNVSYGRKLADYPAVAIALLLLRWLTRDLAAGEIGLLLRTPLVGNGDLGGRSRLELRLRQLPDRRWSPAMITAELRGNGDGEDWLARVAALTKRRRELPRQATASKWALVFDECLRIFGWPGNTAQDSAEFQLINRWRELLNELARLDLVIPRMNLATAQSRLNLLASETLYQAETKRFAVSVMGPLEASGGEFDAIWISGLTAANWPSSSSPSLLISRRLQQSHSMPDATPADTVQYAERLLMRLSGCAGNVICSYATNEGDAEQSATGLLANVPIVQKPSNNDPGWNASQLINVDHPIVVDDDVPKVSANESLSGGAATIQRQLTEPLAAFAFGRLGVNVLYPQAVGITPPMRGNILHDALYHIYQEEPSSAAMRGWGQKDLQRRIHAAVDSAFYRHERNADVVLRQLLKLERLRVNQLLQTFVELDKQRGDYQVTGVEGQLEFTQGDVRLQLRFDRVDRFDDGSVAVLDYKTGATKKLMRNRDEVNEIQLFVYALAIDSPVSALALVNIDSREILFDGVGRDYTDEQYWSELMLRSRNQIESSCRDLESGDVRVNTEQSVKDARSLNLLSRFTELRHGR